MFMVVDLLLGGDLRFHMQNEETLDTTEFLQLFICELSLALDYLAAKHIIHRSVVKFEHVFFHFLRKCYWISEISSQKTFCWMRMVMINLKRQSCYNRKVIDNYFEGHVHLTDFNVATVVKENELAVSMSGTKPYIGQWRENVWIFFTYIKYSFCLLAPEAFACALGECPGYSFAADWWSLGVCCYEILCRKVGDIALANLLVLFRMHPCSLYFAHVEAVWHQQFTYSCGRETHLRYDSTLPPLSLRPTHYWRHQTGSTLNIFIRVPVLTY